MNELEKAVMEWRDAREALFAAPYGDPKSPAQWQRLSVAEHQLMDLAQHYAKTPAARG